MKKDYKFEEYEYLNYPPTTNEIRFLEMILLDITNGYHWEPFSENLAVMKAFIRSGISIDKMTQLKLELAIELQDLFTIQNILSERNPIPSHIADIVEKIKNLPIKNLIKTRLIADKIVSSLSMNTRTILTVQEKFFINQPSAQEELIEMLKCLAPNSITPDIVNSNNSTWSGYVGQITGFISQALEQGTDFLSTNSRDIVVFSKKNVGKTNNFLKTILNEITSSYTWQPSSENLEIIEAFISGGASINDIKDRNLQKNVVVKIKDLETTINLLCGGVSIPSHIADEVERIENSDIKNAIKTGLIVDKIFYKSSIEDLGPKERLFIKNQLAFFPKNDQVVVNLRKRLMKMAEERLECLSKEGLSFKSVIQDILVDRYQVMYLEDLLEDISDPVKKLEAAAKINNLGEVVKLLKSGIEIKVDIEEISNPEIKELIEATIIIDRLSPEILMGVNIKGKNTNIPEEDIAFLSNFFSTMNKIVAETIKDRFEFLNIEHNKNAKMLLTNFIQECNNIKVPDGAVVYLLDSIKYNNPLINHPKFLEMLKIAHAKNMVQEFIALGEDEAVAEGILEAMEIGKIAEVMEILFPSSNKNSINNNALSVDMSSLFFNALRNYLMLVYDSGNKLLFPYSGRPYNDPEGDGGGGNSGSELSCRSAGDQEANTTLGEIYYNGTTYNELLTY